MRVGQVLGFLNLPRLLQFPARSGVYQALRATDGDDVEEGLRIGVSSLQADLAGKGRWAPIYRRFIFYLISFLCNAFLVLLGFAGWQISSERDSNQTTKNRDTIASRFLSATAYSVPALATSGILLFWLCRQRKLSHTTVDSTMHIKLFLFTAASNALAAIFMIIFTMIFDDPETRFGTGDDCRNALIPLIIVLHIVSFAAALSAVYILLRGVKPVSSSYNIPADSGAVVLDAVPTLPRGLKAPLRVTIPGLEPDAQNPSA